MVRAYCPSCLSSRKLVRALLKSALREWLESLTANASMQVLGSISASPAKAESEDRAHEAGLNTVHKIRPHWLFKVFMYRRPILCTLYSAVDFLNVPKKGCWWGWGVCYWYIVKYIMYLLWRLHTAFLHWPLSSAATKEVQGPDTT